MIYIKRLCGWLTRRIAEPRQARFRAGSLTPRMTSQEVMLQRALIGFAGSRSPIRSVGLRDRYAPICLRDGGSGATKQSLATSCPTRCKKPPKPKPGSSFPWPAATLTSPSSTSFFKRTRISWVNSTTWNAKPTPSASDLPSPLLLFSVSPLLNFSPSHPLRCPRGRGGRVAGDHLRYLQIGVQ